MASLGVVVVLVHHPLSVILRCARCEVSWKYPADSGRDSR